MIQEVICSDHVSLVPIQFRLCFSFFLSKTKGFRPYYPLTKLASYKKSIDGNKIWIKDIMDDELFLHLNIMQFTNGCIERVTERSSALSFREIHSCEHYSTTHIHLEQRKLSRSQRNDNAFEKTIAALIGICFSLSVVCSGVSVCESISISVYVCVCPCVCLSL